MKRLPKIIILVILFVSILFYQCLKSRSRFEMFVYSEQGKRDYQEDTYSSYQDKNGFEYFAVFDGHGGTDLQKHGVKKDTDGELIKKILKTSFVQFNKKIFAIDEKYNFVGSTAAVVTVIGDRLFSSSVGDSLIFLYETRCGNSKNSSHDLSVEHNFKNPEETKRLKKVFNMEDDGSFFYKCKNVRNRLNGILAITRAFGDNFFSECLIAEPHVVETRIYPNDYIVIASDGLFERWRKIDIYDYMVTVWKDSLSSGEYVVRNLGKRASSSGSKDNITILLLKYL